MGSAAIDIPAGARDYAITDSYTLPVDVDLLSLYPHAHFLGKDMQVVATPSGRLDAIAAAYPAMELPLAAGLPLRRGRTAAARHDDQHAFHLRQLGRQPRQPSPSSGAGDGGAAFNRRDGQSAAPDGAALSRGPRAADPGRGRRDAAANLGAAEMLARSQPDNAENQIFLGSSYVDVGRIADGILHLERALRLDPASARAHNELGGALLTARPREDAVAYFSARRRWRPPDARTPLQSRHGVGRRRRGRRCATDVLERALAMHPDSPRRMTNWVSGCSPRSGCARRSRIFAERPIWRRTLRWRTATSAARWRRAGQLRRGAGSHAARAGVGSGQRRGEREPGAPCTGQTSVGSGLHPASVSSEPGLQQKFFESRGRREFRQSGDPRRAASDRRSDPARRGELLEAAVEVLHPQEEDRPLPGGDESRCVQRVRAPPGSGARHLGLPAIACARPSEAIMRGLFGASWAPRSSAASASSKSPSFSCTRLRMKYACGKCGLSSIAWSQYARATSIVAPVVVDRCDFARDDRRDRIERMREQHFVARLVQTPERDEAAPRVPVVAGRVRRDRAGSPAGTPARHRASSSALAPLRAPATSAPAPTRRRA